MGEKCVFVRVGKAFLCTKKGYYIPLIIWRRCREVGEKRPHIILSALTYSKNEKNRIVP